MAQAALAQAQTVPAEKQATHDRSTIEAVIDLYLDGLYEGSAEKIGSAFDTTADLRWVENGKLEILPVPQWLERVKTRPSAKSQNQPRGDFVVTIDKSDENNAFVKLRCQLPPRYFTDYLSLMKLADGWKIVSKSYRYETR